MDETAVTPSALAIEAILIALADDLEAALDAVASAGAERRFEEIMTLPQRRGARPGRPTADRQV